MLAHAGRLLMIAALADARSVLSASPMLAASPISSGRFDTKNVANPVVLPPAKAGDVYRMFYYGGDGVAWKGGLRPFLPTGSCGLAESEDGVSWTKVDGPLPGGAVFSASDDERAWDGAHVGVGDVLVDSADGQRLTMYYFGGDRQEVPGFGGVLCAGLRMCIGRAFSTDGGRTWAREGEPVLRPSAEEGLFAGWPRVLALDGGRLRMLYHAFDGSSWRVYSASSADGGRSWTREGCALAPGAAGAFDAMGCGTRAVLREPDGRLWMLYEGVDTPERLAHRLGYAESDDDGLSWRKLTPTPARDEGGPVLEPGAPPLEPWAHFSIGTPWLLRDSSDGSVRLYHCGNRADGEGMAIGCLELPAGGTAFGAAGADWRPLGRASLSASAVHAQMLLSAVVSLKPHSVIIT